MLRVSPTQTQTTLILHPSHERSGGTHIPLGMEAQVFPLPSTLSPTLPYELFHLATREFLPVVLGVSDPPLLIVVAIYLSFLILTVKRLDFPRTYWEYLQGSGALEIGVDFPRRGDLRMLGVLGWKRFHKAWNTSN